MGKEAKASETDLIGTRMSENTISCHNGNRDYKMSKTYNHAEDTEP